RHAPCAPGATLPRHAGATGPHAGGAEGGAGVSRVAVPGLEGRSAGRGPGVPVRKLEILPRRLQRLRRGYPLARGGVERWPAGVVGDLEPAPLVAGNPVYETSPVIRPHGQRLLGEPHVARGRAEKEDLLAGSADPITNDVRKQLPQPRTACEHEGVGRDRAAVGELDVP